MLCATDFEEDHSVIFLKYVAYSNMNLIVLYVFVARCDLKKK